MNFLPTIWLCTSKKKIAKYFNFDSIINKLKNIKERRTILHIYVTDFIVTIILKYIFIFIASVNLNI